MQLRFSCFTLKEANMARHTRIPMYLDAIVRHHRFAPRSCKVAESCMRIRQGKVMRLGMLWQEREADNHFSFAAFVVYCVDLWDVLHWCQVSMLLSFILPFFEKKWC